MPSIRASKTSCLLAGVTVSVYLPVAPAYTR